MGRINRIGRLVGAGLLVLSGPVVLGSRASANCLATLHASPRLAPAGSTVTLFGRNYSSSATSSNIEIRLDGRTGRVIASFTPRSGLQNVPVTVPADVPPGLHTLVATQYNGSGNPVSCTPGRATIEVFAPAGASATGSVAGPLAPSSPEGISDAGSRRGSPSVGSGLDEALVVSVGLSLVVVILLANRSDRRSRSTASGVPMSPSMAAP